MQQLAKGQNFPLNDPTLRLSPRASEPVDLSAVLLGADGRVRGDADFVFYNQPSAPGVQIQGSELVLTPAQIDPAIERVVLIVSLDGRRSATFGALPGGIAVTFTGAAPIAEFAPAGMTNESALNLVELYRRNGQWKVRAVGQGWSDGLGGLARSFGVDVADDGGQGAGHQPGSAQPGSGMPPAQPAAPQQPAPPAAPQQSAPPSPAPQQPAAQPGAGFGQPPAAHQQPPTQQPPAQQPQTPPQPPAYEQSQPPQQPAAQRQPAQQPGAGFGQPPAPQQAPQEPTPPPAPAQPTTIRLEKRGDARSVSLDKAGQPQPIHVNLNWQQGRWRGNIDLDLGCFVEFVTGHITGVQPLGNAFGSEHDFPWIKLDKDDRSGSSRDGENLTIYRPDFIKRILIFAMIYEGTGDFRSAKATVTLRDHRGNVTYVDLDNPSPRQRWCGVAMITNDGNGNIAITKDERYFQGHRDADAHYAFGFEFRAGRK